MYKRKAENNYNSKDTNNSEMLNKHKRAKLTEDDGDGTQSKQLSDCQILVVS